MKADQKCPKCGSENVHFIKKRQIYECEEETCKHEFTVGVSSTVDRCAKRQRIFLSYGHDKNAGLVEKIRADLENLGHDVWIDSSEIKFGDDWRRSITEGIVGSDLMLSFLSRHSTRDPGVCLDELSIALGTKTGVVQTILVESEQEVTPPVSISHIQWLDMNDWKAHWDHDTKTPLADTWYEEKLAEIVRVLASDTNKRFAGEIEELKKRLKPLSPDTRIGGLLKQGFVGREWLVREINIWRQENRDSRVFFLTGKPGVGKSAFAAWLAHHSKANIIAAHFIEYNKPDRREPRRVIMSIAFQIASRLPDFRKFLLGLPELEQLEEKNSEELFTYLLAEPLRNAIRGGRERYAILIDGLDEASDDKSNSLVDIIAQEAPKLPEWITIIITSRPNPAIMRRLSNLAPKELAADDERNRSDLFGFIRTWIENSKISLTYTELSIQSIVEASEGNFLYLRQFCEGAEKGWLDITDARSFPKGMIGMYQGYFRRQFPDIEAYEKYQVPLLELIVAAFEPLLESLAEQALGWKGRGRIKVLDPLGSLFQRQDGRISPFHKSIQDWLTNPDDSGEYYIPFEDGHRKLADHGWKQYEEDVEKMDDYSLAWLPMHLAQVAEQGKLVMILKDFNYTMARVKAGYLERMFEDYRETVNVLPPDLRRQLRIEEAFFRERAHILRRGNEEWPVYKILFQLAIEHADDSPVTKLAEKYMEERKLDWVWLRAAKRLRHCDQSPCIFVFEGHVGNVHGAAIISKNRIVSWSFDETLRIWSIETGQCLSTLHGHTEQVSGAMEIPENKLLSWSWDDSLKLWDLDSNQLINTFTGHSGDVFGALRLSDGGIISWSRDKTLRLWSLQEDKCLATMRGHNEKVCGAIELPDGDLISWSQELVGNSKSIMCWNRNTANCIGALEYLYKDGSHEVFYLSDDKLLLWEGSVFNPEISLFDKNTGLITLRRKEPSLPILLSDGRQIARDQIQSLCLRDANGMDIAFYRGHTGWIGDAILLPDERLLSWGDNTLRLWDLSLKITTDKIDRHDDDVYLCFILNNGHLLTVGAVDDATARIWEVNTGECVLKFEGPMMEVMEISDNRLLSWSIFDEKICIWDCKTGEVLEVYNVDDKELMNKLNDFSVRLEEKMDILSGLIDSAKTDIKIPIFQNKQNSIGLFTVSKKQSVGISHTHQPLKHNIALWHADANAEDRWLLLDGTIVVTQEGGRVDFLKLYDGNRRITLDELEAKIAVEGKR
jgi:WD40 repeat protein